MTHRPHLMSRTGWGMVLALASAAGLVVRAEQGASPPTPAAPTAPASATPQTPPTFRGGANFVSVDVYPRRDGRIVEGLKLEDFQIFEDGRLQQPGNFEFIRFDPVTADEDRRDPTSQEDGDRAAADPKNRVFVVYLDPFHTSRQGGRDARSVILGFLQRAVGATDLFAVLTPEVPVSTMVFGRRMETIDTELSTHEDWGTKGEPLTPRTEFERALTQNCLGQMPFDAVDALIRLHRDDLLYTSLEGLMIRLRDLRDERKYVLLVSEGWVPRQSSPGLITSGSGSIPPIGVGSGGRLGVGASQSPTNNHSACDAAIARLAGMDFVQRFRDLLETARRANVAFLPVDVGGLRTGGGFGVTDTLRTLAESTGGLATVLTNDISGRARAMADAIGAYYRVGYYSNNPKFDGRFRRIEVKVGQPHVAVSARSGYLAPSEADFKRATNPAAAVSTVPAALTEALGRLARVRAGTVLFAAGTPVADGLDVVAELASGEMATSQWTAGAAITVTIARADGTTATANGRIEPGARGGMVHVPASVAGPGPWRIHVRAAEGTASADQPLEIALAEGASLGTPALWRGGPSPRTPPRPAADAQFRRVERLTVAVPLLKPATPLIAHVLDRRGQALPVDAAITSDPHEGDADWRVTVNLMALADGDYVLELAAGDPAAAERRFTAFRVIR